MKTKLLKEARFSLFDNSFSVIIMNIVDHSKEYDKFIFCKDGTLHSILAYKGHKRRIYDRIVIKDEFVISEKKERYMALLWEVNSILFRLKYSRDGIKGMFRRLFFKRKIESCYQRHKKRMSQFATVGG